MSVVIPLYNKAAYISRAVQSVLAQQVQDFEVLVVDDGSTDAGPEIASAFADPRLRVVRQENAGEGAARNRGGLEAQASLVAFCDADDEWFPEFLPTILRLHAAFPQCGMFATGYLMRDPNGRDSSPILRGLPDRPWEGVLKDYFATACQSDPPVCSSSVAVRRDALEAVGGFPTRVRIGTDLLGWARLAAQYEVAISTDPQAVFWLRETYPSPPVRMPDVPDVVGRELAQLAASAPAKRRSTMRRYAGMWHRMRAIIFTYHGRRADALSEIMQALRLTPADEKLYALVAVALLPTALRDATLRSIERWRRRQRTSS